MRKYHIMSRAKDPAGAIMQTASTNGQPAAITTEAVELQVARARECLGSFGPGAINEQGTYEAPASRALDLHKAMQAIEKALQMINNDVWSEEDEPPPPVSPHITKLRARCLALLQEIQIDVRETGEQIKTTDDSRQLAAAMRRLMQIAEDFGVITTILHTNTFPPPRINQC